jgi:N-acetylmuramoyl-L-alanine amidase
MNRCREIFVTVFVVAVIFGGVGSTFALDKGIKREKNTVDTIIIHAIGGPDVTCPRAKLEFTPAGGRAAVWKDYFAKHDTVSIHYIIDREGNLESSIKEDEIAIHAGHSNARSIGIELVNKGDGVEEYQDAAVTRLIGLIKDIRTRINISVDNIKGHEEVDQTKFTCGGKEYKRKVDPGPKFPWRKLKEALR